MAQIIKIHKVSARLIVYVSCQVSGIFFMSLPSTNIPRAVAICSVVSDLVAVNWWQFWLHIILVQHCRFLWTPTRSSSAAQCWTAPGVVDEVHWITSKSRQLTLLLLEKSLEQVSMLDSATQQGPRFCKCSRNAEGVTGWCSVRFRVVHTSC